MKFECVPSAETLNLRTSVPSINCREAPAVYNWLKTVDSEQHTVDAYGMHTGQSCPHLSELRPKRSTLEREASSELGKFKVAFLRWRYFKALSGPYVS